MPAACARRLKENPLATVPGFDAIAITLFKLAGILSIVTCTRHPFLKRSYDTPSSTSRITRSQIVDQEEGGNAEEQIRGIIAQAVIYTWFDIPLPKDLQKPDEGKDLVYRGVSIDVKTMGRTVPMRSHYVHNFMKSQVSFRCDVLLFCSFRKDTHDLTVCGWLKKSDLTRLAKYYAQGTWRTRDDGSRFQAKRDMYEVPNGTLHDVVSIQGFKDDMERFSASRTPAAVVIQESAPVPLSPELRHIYGVDRSSEPIVRL
jgi:hypothetical protein